MGALSADAGADADADDDDEATPLMGCCGSLDEPVLDVAPLLAELIAGGAIIIRPLVNWLPGGAAAQYKR